MAKIHLGKAAITFGTEEEAFSKAAGSLKSMSILRQPRGELEFTALRLPVPADPAFSNCLEVASSVLSLGWRSDWLLPLEISET